MGSPAQVVEQQPAVEVGSESVVEEQIVEEIQAPVESEESKAVTALLVRLATADKAAVDEIVALVKSRGVVALKEFDLFEKLKAAIDDKAPLAREGAILACAALCEIVGKPCEPYLFPVVSSIVDKYADKAAPVRSAAATFVKQFLEILSPFSVKQILPVLFSGMEFKNKWQSRVAYMEMLGALAKVAPEQLALAMPEIVPVLTEHMSDSKNQVSAAAYEAMTQACSTVDNIDIERFIPALISSIARPVEVPDCVQKLAATTFVQAVKSPTLSILVPVLIRGLRERMTVVKRQTAVIIDNMSQLVDDPLDAAVFLPKLLPGLERMKEEVADPEVRGVANRAHQTLLRVGAEGKDIAEAAPEKVDAKAVTGIVKEVVEARSDEKLDEFFMQSIQYAAVLCAELIALKNFEINEWKRCVAPYVVLLVEGNGEEVCKEVLDRCYEDSQGMKKPTDDDEDEGEDLCDCEFSLAYGAKILLNNAKLHLKRGRRYGLCGPNGAGKSTLMRAIANGQLEGFPPKEELRTVYVEHDIDASVSEMAVVEFVFQDPALQGTTHPAHEQVESVLSSVGFTSVMQQQPVASLSGGWKMKLALARAMLMKADIMLLDEPTNHLDVTNVAWLENYLTHLPEVTSMVVSHDSGFLDNVCTDIIHYEGKKLKRYRGNLSEFVKVRPEAAAYYKLSAATLKFKLPEPGFLEGIKSKDRAILKMQKVGFKYPGMTKNVISDVSIALSLNSRVGVVGANGAGKSTMIKLLTGEIESQDGTVWKHPNLRVAYVAQHAFHHVEQHLTMTPSQYIQWRYQIGEDRESLEKVNRQVSEAEEKAMAKLFLHDGVKKVVEKLVSRRKLKKSYEYEVQWKGLHPDENAWLTRDKLEEMGFIKMVNEIDMKEAARLGMHTKPLTQVVIQKHLEDLGLDAEVINHTHIRGLSGGQKVKVVIGAAMWLNPHMLVLDEPTNYLDRESLGALAGAIKDFGGGVVMISHNKEFVEELCPETWLVAEGKLTATGQSAATQEAQKLEWKAQETMIDAFGNEVKIKQPKKKLSNKDKKKLEKVRKARRERGEEVSDTDEDE